jgi:hypothetical protein
MPQDLSGGLVGIHTLDWLDEITRASVRRPHLQKSQAFCGSWVRLVFSREDQPFIPAASSPERQYVMIQEFFPGTATRREGGPGSRPHRSRLRDAVTHASARRKNRTAATQKCVTMRRRAHAWRPFSLNVRHNLWYAHRDKVKVRHVFAAWPGFDCHG